MRLVSYKSRSLVLSVHKFNNSPCFYLFFLFKFLFLKSLKIYYKSLSQVQVPVLFLNSEVNKTWPFPFDKSLQTELMDG